MQPAPGAARHAGGVRLRRSASAFGTLETFVDLAHRPLDEAEGAHLPRQRDSQLRASVSDFAVKNF
jgi:hypothetical protein